MHVEIGPNSDAQSVHFTCLQMTSGLLSTFSITEVHPKAQAQVRAVVQNPLGHNRNWKCSWKYLSHLGRENESFQPFLLFERIIAQQKTANQGNTVENSLFGVLLMCLCVDVWFFWLLSKLFQFAKLMSLYWLKIYFTLSARGLFIC